MIGKTVSHYDVLYRLGSGGMGEVYAARDTLLGRMVAIKVLQMADVATAEDRLRFLQEARAASALNHPNIVTIYDVIRDGADDCIVMELVAGQTLDVRLHTGPIPLEETLDILDRVADALSVAHARGIVHRDLKPGNLMITSTGGLKILDFGLAKIVADSDADLRYTSPRTQSGLAIGTPYYMSPEQALGKPLDGRSDLFSLGSVAVEALTGINPFESNSVVETMHQIVYGAPSRESLQKVPEQVRGLIAKMLAKQKEDRFQTAGELRMAIAAIRRGARVEGPQEHAKYKRQFMVASAVTLLLTAAGIGAAQMWRPRDPASPSAVRTTNARSFAPPSTAHDHVRQGNTLLSTYWRKGYVEKAIAEFQRAIAIDAEHAAAHAGLAAAYWRKYDSDNDDAWLELSARTARHAIDLNPQLAAGHLALAVAEVRRGNLDAASKELEQAAIIDPANAAAQRWLGEVASRRKDGKTAEAQFRKAIALRPKDAELQLALGSFLYSAARNDEAAEAFRRSIAIAPDNARAFRNLGAALYMRNDYTGAAHAFQQSLEIEPNPTVYSNLGTLYFFQGLYPQAVAAFEQAVKHGANNHNIWANLGDAYRWTPGNEKKAREAYAVSLNLLSDELRKQPNDPALGAFQALCLAKQGEKEKALHVADALVRAENNPHNLYRLALAFELSGARQKSLLTLSQAIQKGYSTEEVKLDPELASMRRDVQFQRMMVAVQ